MPNLKLQVDQGLWRAKEAALAAALPDLRGLLCRLFSVDAAACQLAAFPVLGLPDQPLANAELFILPRPDRTRDMVTGAAEAIRASLAGTLGTPVAVRISQLDAPTYVALK